MPITRDLLPFERNHTEPGGRFPREAVGYAAVPDALIHELQRSLPEEQLESEDPRLQFTIAGYTDADLMLSPYCDPETYGQKLIDNTLAWDAASGSPAPSIAVRVNVYLRVLFSSRSYADLNFFPGATEKAQRGLSSLLIDYPVLLHPRVRMRADVEGFELGNYSVAHVIGRAISAHLPMESDWPLGEAPIDKLEAFANARVLWDSLTTPSIPTQGSDDRIDNQTVLAVALAMRDVRPATLAALHELGTRVVAAKSPLGAFIDQWSKLLPPESKTHRRGYDELLAANFLRACGMLSASGPTPEAALRARCPEFLRLVRLHPEQAKLDMLPELRETMLDVMTMYSTRTNPANAPSETFSCAVDALIDGLIDADMLSDTAPALARSAASDLDDESPADGATTQRTVAAEWIRTRFVESRLPDTDAEPAMAFLRALESNGVTLTLGDFVRDTEDLPRTLTEDQLEAARPGWGLAYRTATAQRVMSNVIDAASPAPGLAEESSDPPPAPAPSHRRRGV